MVRRTHFLPVVLLLCNCGGNSKGAVADAAASEDVEVAPLACGIQLGALLSDIEGLRVVFGAADGSVIGTETTASDGSAYLASCEPNTIITVAREGTMPGSHQLFTFVGVQPGDLVGVLNVDVPVDPMQTVSVTLSAGAPGTADNFRVTAGCDPVAATPTVASAPANVGPACTGLDPSNYDILGVASAGTTPVAWQFARNVPVSAGAASSATLMDWVTPVATQVANATTSDAAAGSHRMIVAQLADGVPFDTRNPILTFVDGATFFPFPLLPTGFVESVLVTSYLDHTGPGTSWARHHLAPGEVVMTDFDELLPKILPPLVNMDQPGRPTITWSAV